MDERQTRADRRERKRTNRLRKRIHHGKGKRAQKQGISKAWKKEVAKKIKIKK